MQVAEGPQGSEQLLHSKGAVSWPRAGTFPTHSPTDTGICQGPKAARAEPDASELYCWSVYCGSPAGFTARSELPATEARLVQV